VLLQSTKGTVIVLQPASAERRQEECENLIENLGRGKVLSYLRAESHGEKESESSGGHFSEFEGKKKTIGSADHGGNRVGKAARASSKKKKER